MRPGLLVSDFDGTITRNDFYRLIVETFAPSGLETFWKGYVEGRYSHFEALAGIFATLRATEPEVLLALQRSEAEPELAAWVGRLNEAGWDVVIASAGCQWYIERILSSSGVRLEVHANPGRYEEGRGLIMELPHGSRFFCPRVGIDKAAVVRAGLERGQVLAFAGDGFTDLPAAKLVPEQRRFARVDLATALQNEGLPFRPFERWGEVARALCESGPGR
jgi:2,3-diketo-5-methylthio-1-phosphopentane phosphatase